jgi:hypothetical protein
MEGFTGEMQNRIQGVLSDVIFEARSMDGMPDFEMHAEETLAPRKPRRIPRRLVAHTVGRRVFGRSGQRRHQQNGDQQAHHGASIAHG